MPSLSNKWARRLKCKCLRSSCKCSWLKETYLQGVSSGSRSGRINHLFCLGIWAQACPWRLNYFSRSLSKHIPWFFFPSPLGRNMCRVFHWSLWPRFLRPSRNSADALQMSCDFLSMQIEETHLKKYLSIVLLQNEFIFTIQFNFKWTFFYLPLFLEFSLV